MTKLLIALFAHPDDEAFGPSGTLLKLRDEGYDIHLILLTDGDAGTNVDNVPDLAATRLAEWHASAELLGARTTHALHYPDGGLQNIAAAELEQAAATTIAAVIASYTAPVELSFITFEPHGLTGHHDHIVASDVAARMAERFSARDIWYFCLDSSQAPLDGTAYYEPRAREERYITTRVDVSAYLTRKYQVIDAHISQRHDGAAMKTPGAATECFHVDTVSS